VLCPITQNEDDVHHTLLVPPGIGVPLYVQALAPPVGLVDDARLALASTATQNVLDGQETSVGARLVNTVLAGVTVHVRPAFVEVTMSLLLSTATHSEDDGHETPLKVYVLSIVCGADQPPPFEVVTAGRAVFTGAAGNTPALAFDVTLPEPPALLAVTTTRKVCPTSPSTGV
jgi:hypothetical protein